MAIDFKEKITELKQKDIADLTQEELGYISVVENYIDSVINKDLSTDKEEVWIDKSIISFHYNPITKKGFPVMTRARQSFLTTKLLSKYEKANWKITWEDTDYRDSMTGGDYLILKGIR